VTITRVCETGTLACESKLDSETVWAALCTRLGLSKRMPSASSAAETEAERWAAAADHARDAEEEATRLHVHNLEGLINTLVPAGGTFVLVDDEQSGLNHFTDRQKLPCLERGGIYWGPPIDDTEAIEEVKRQRSRGASHLILAWPSFWWLDHYRGFSEQLSNSYRRVLINEYLIAFDLREVAVDSSHH
jgi:hypothetical protein